MKIKQFAKNDEITSLKSFIRSPSVLSAQRNALRREYKLIQSVLKCTGMPDSEEFISPKIQIQNA